MIQYTIHSGTVMIETPNGFLRLMPYSDSIVRVTYAPTEAFSTRQSLMVNYAPSVPVDMDLSETAEALVFSTSKLSIQINRRTGAFTYLDSSGQLLTKEPDRGGKTLMPTDVVRSIFDETAEAQIRKDADGVHAHVPSARQVVDRQAFHTKLEFEWMPGEALYGLGSHEEGMMNLRGQDQGLWHPA